MESGNGLFLQALRASLQNRTVDWEAEQKPGQWEKLFAAAQAHRVLPLIYGAVIHSPAAEKTDPRFFQPYRRQVLQSAAVQTVKTDELLKLLPALQAAGVTPLVVKGIICRRLYPDPDGRVSADEDVLIPPLQLERCRQVLHECGLEPLDPQQDSSDYELPYGKRGSPLRIELHTHLFPPASAVSGEMNRFFADAHQRSITQTIQGVPVPTLDRTDHLLYLICHAFKHFLYSGVGIRQVCDICLYANAYGAGIDWQLVRRRCEEIQGEYFAAALFRIGQNYLTFDPEKACCLAVWDTVTADETNLLADLLDSGIYGASSMSRKHSSGITLHAVSADRQEKSGRGGALKAAFPPAAQLTGRYPYLREKPYLLPLAWADRIMKYRRETAADHRNNSASRSIQIGNERIRLLKEYRIIR